MTAPNVEFPSGTPIALPHYSVDPVTKAPIVSWPVAATQSGVWTVQPGNTANTTPWLFNINNPTTLGQQLSASSYPVVLANDYTAPISYPYSELQGNGPSVVNGANTDLFGWIDVSAYRWLSLAISGTYSGTLTFQMSPDQSLVLSHQLMTATSFSSSNVSSATSSTNSIFVGPVLTRYFRVRMTSFSSNASLGGILGLYTQAPNFMLGQVNSVLTSSSASIGTTTFHLVSGASNNATAVKNASGNVYSYEVYNANAAARFLKFYNKTTAPNPASDTVVHTVGIPGSSRVERTVPQGINFSTGIAIATVTGIGDTDNTSVGASDLSVEIDYK